MKNLKFIDLFCGTGAFSYVLEQNNCECVFSNDFDKTSKIMYQNNFKNGCFNDKNLNDINLEKDIPKHDILCGGFPCQPFSIAGNKEGFNDSRSNVFFKILEILKYHEPNFIILENVKNLLTHDNKNTFKIIKERLEDLGYHLKYSIFDTAKVTNIPQHRERIYIIGMKNSLLFDELHLDFIKDSNNDESKLKPIENLLESNVDSKYYYTSKYTCYNTIIRDITKHINTNTIYQYRRTFVRENKNSVCPTLTANMGSGGHNVPLLKDDNGIRKLTPRECFNLQGFPNDYNLNDLSDAALYKLAGNAISIPVLDLIVKKLFISADLIS